MAIAPPRPGTIFTGTCAWSFDDWRDVFYPHSLPRNRWLEHYAHHFPSVEMDSSFFHMPSARTAHHWAELVGPAFRFCPNVPRSLSHEKHLADPSPEIGMMRRLAAELEGHMGCSLLQMPSSFHARPAEHRALRGFLNMWPAELPLAIEFRHESWETAHAASLLARYGVAWVWADRLALDREKHAGFGFLPVTAKHLYIRLLGDPRTKYGPDGSLIHHYGRLQWPRETSLEHWAVKIRHHGEAEAVYVLVHNHYEGMAVDTVRRLSEKLGFGMLSVGLSGGEQLELFGDGSAR
ncbi:MAG: DUF72 domain-containing protein [Chthoniobacterales bacterium]|nr:DUF72 domain-containing protein [Chthoniobacterales bacterium]